MNSVIKIAADDLYHVIQHVSSIDVTVLYGNNETAFFFILDYTFVVATNSGPPMWSSNIKQSEREREREILIVWRN